MLCWGETSMGRAHRSWRMLLVGIVLRTWRKRCQGCGLPTALPTEAVMGPRLWVAGTVIVSDVLLVAACHLACVVTNQGDALLATRAGYSPTQVNG